MGPSAIVSEKEWLSRRDSNGFLRSEEAALFLSPMVVTVDLTQQLEQGTTAAWGEEIERAVVNVKRTQWDKWMRREWHKADSRRQWPADRQARWEDWREQHSHGTTRREASHPERASVTPSKVWVRGHVPHWFLDWLEMHWSHDVETKAMLSECCFEVWERGK